MTSRRNVEILVVGAGLAGISTAFYLCTKHKKTSVLLVDSRQPMSFTSASSGDNYRNWWPHRTMTDFTNHSIDLMEQIARDTSNSFNMTRRGYVLASRRSDVDGVIADLHTGYRHSSVDSIRVHDSSSAGSYVPPRSGDWSTAPDGVDVMSNQALIRQIFPSLSEEIATVVHIRRAGDISGQQLGQYMLEKIRDAGGTRLTASVGGIDPNQPFLVDIAGSDDTRQIRADVIVNAAGPFAGKLAARLGVHLPIENVYQQKIAFDDKYGAIPRQLPFSCDLDGFSFDWTGEERTLLAEDSGAAWLIGPLPGGVHCRPEGGDNGSWVKLGWAYNQDVSEPLEDLANEPRMEPHFPELVVRAAARLNPSLIAYVNRFPTRFSHYGGYYAMTPENWPLLGPMGVEGAYVTGALSGFGSMSACAAGAVCAAWITGEHLPDYAQQLSLARYDDEALMAELANARTRGIL